MAFKNANITNPDIKVTSACSITVCHHLAYFMVDSKSWPQLRKLSITGQLRKFNIGIYCWTRQIDSNPRLFPHFIRLANELIAILLLKKELLSKSLFSFFGWPVFHVWCSDGRAQVGAQTRTRAAANNSRKNIARRISLPAWLKKTEPASPFHFSKKFLFSLKFRFRVSNRETVFYFRHLSWCLRPLLFSFKV